jgi:hypothetical protein
MLVMPFLKLSRYVSLEVADEDGVLAISRFWEQEIGDRKQITENQFFLSANLTARDMELEIFKHPDAHGVLKRQTAPQFPRAVREAPSDLAPLVTPLWKHFRSKSGHDISNYEAGRGPPRHCKQDEV